MADFSASPRTAPSTVTGTRGPENENAVRLVADVKDEIYLYMPNKTPLSVFTGRVKGQRTAHQYKFDILEQDEYPRNVELAAASLVADTTLDVVAGQGVRVPTFGVYLNTRTAESVYVSSIATDALTVVRGIGSIQQDMNAGDTLIFLRAVFPDGGSKGSFKTVQVGTDFNYTEIIKTGFGFTGRQMNTEWYGGSDVQSTRKWVGIEHAKSIEYMMFFGTRNLIAASGSTHITTFSGGADYFIKSNIWNLDGTVPNERSFLEFLEEAMRWGKGGFLTGAGTKYLFASTQWLTEINFWAHDRIRIEQSEKFLGIKVLRYVSPHGDVLLVHTPILDYFHSDRAYLIDLNHVDQVVHRGRGTKIVKDIQAPDFDGTEEQWISDIGAEWSLESSHALLKGLGRP